MSVFLGNGAGSFGKKGDFGSGSSIRSLEMGDINGDGALDPLLPIMAAVIARC